MANVFVDDVELVLLADNAPDNSNVLNDDVDRHRQQRADDAQHESPDTKAHDREGLDDAEDVHVHVHRADERAEEVHQRRAGDGAERSEDQI